MEPRTKILLHCCCGPCATSAIEALLKENWLPVLFFGNSNIFPKEENQRRYEELLKVASFYGLKTIRAPYDHESWLKFVKGLEKCPEHGARCVKCFEFNLRQTYEAAQRLGIENFATSLTVSRFKNSLTIFDAAEGLGGFKTFDFKKKDGFNRSVVLSRQMNLYRQRYCGCEFSAQGSKNAGGGIH